MTTKVMTKKTAARLIADKLTSQAAGAGGTRRTAASKTAASKPARCSLGSRRLEDALKAREALAARLRRRSRR